MNSSPLKGVSKATEDGYFNEKVTDMSPITDLAFNLKGLKTNLTATPTRRISWSDPLKNITATKCAGDFSPAVDSPMFQEIPIKIGRRCKKTLSRKISSMYSGEEKENIPPAKDMQCGNISASDNDSVVLNDSQDSGYSGASQKQFDSVNKDSTSRLNLRRSLLTDTNDESLDGLFEMDCDNDMEPAPTSSMSSLLTKPLCNMENIVDSSRNDTPFRRRCLTMEIQSSSDSSSFTRLGFSNSNTQMSSMAGENADSLPTIKLPFKRPDPSSILEWQNKRRKSSPAINLPDVDIKMDFIKQRSFSETAATIMQAVQKADLQPDLIGDCSRFYALPLVKGRHQDLKCISSETLVQVLRGDYNEHIDGYTLIDCRYPYEYEGGHIKGAKNIYTKEEILQTFLEKVPEPASKSIIIFHCEFSSERAPNLCRFLRNKDRELNECSYPKLHHPEIYLLEGGYKAFFANFREFCEPQGYKPMNHKDHSSDLRLFRAKSKTWGSDSKSKYKMKLALGSTNI